MGATIYKALTGQTPPDALDRMAEDTLTPPSRLGVSIPPAAEQALLQALAVNAGQRFQTMGEFQQALSGGRRHDQGVPAGRCALPARAGVQFYPRRPSGLGPDPRFMPHPQRRLLIIPKRPGGRPIPPPSPRAS